MASCKLTEVFAFLLLICTQSGLCLRCYECNSAVDEGCERSPPPQKYLVECLNHQDQESHKFQYTITPEGPTTEGSNPPSTPSSPPQDVSSTPQAITTNQDTSHPPQSTAETSPSSGDTTTTLPQSPAASPEPSQNPSSEPSTAGPPEATSAQQPSSEAPSTEATNAANPQRRMRRANVNDSGDSFITVYPDIPMEATYCRKVSTYIPEQENGNATLPEQTRIVRGCGWIPDPDDVKADTNTTQPGTNPQSCKWLGIDGVQTLKCICKAEGCNSAQSLESLRTQTVLLLGLMASGCMYIL